MNDRSERRALRLVSSNDRLPMGPPEKYAWMKPIFTRARMEAGGVTNGKPNSLLLREDDISLQPDPEGPPS